jgi:hypothetical protein
VTLRDPAISAGSDHPGQLRSETFEQAETGLDGLEMCRCQPPGTVTGLIRLFLQLQQVAHRIQLEPKITERLCVSA